MRLSRPFTRPCLGAVVALLASLSALRAGHEGMPAPVPGAPMAQDPAGMGAWPLGAHADRSYPCDQCAWHTWTPRALERHRSRHTNERPYVCGECLKGFAAPGNLRRHRRTHLGAQGPAVVQEIAGAIENMDLSRLAEQPGGAAE